MSNIVHKIANKIIWKLRKIFYCLNESKGNQGKNSHSEVILSHLSYYCGNNNVGDTVLSKCVRQTLKSSFLVKKICLLSINKNVNEKLIDKINKSNALIIGGGGLFLPDTNENNISGWQWAISSEQLESIKVPIIIYAVGYNYFRGQKPNELFIENLNLLLKKSKFIGIRNNGSINELKKIVSFNLQDKIVYQPCPTTIIRKIFNNISQKEITKNVAINIAFDRSDRRFGANKEIILKQVAYAIKRIELNGYLINYVAHCEKDLEFCKYLNKENVIYKSFDFSKSFPYEVINFYNKMDVVLGMRGHSQMIPFGLNCDIISLGTHEKMKWFLQDINAEDWYIELSDDIYNLSNNIVDKFNLIHIKNHKSTHERLLDEQNKLYKIHCANIEKIKQIIT